MIPAADTRLYAVDAPGGTPALLFLSGGFGTVQNWSRVISRLDGKYRTVRFDARARGKSGRSADYSVFATTPHKHTQILSKAPDTVVAAIEEVIHESS
jgi:pimeloyl-ACP methyl ester carboxylesterase